jgi:hypothetical protein
MTIELPSILESELRSLAGMSGKDVGILVEEAVRQYLDAASIADIHPSDLSATQELLVPELPGFPEWSDEDQLQR